jgi:hypothetical protein
MGDRIEEFLDDVEPWERQPRESDQAWAAFRHYRELEPPRTIRQLREHLFAEEQKVGDPSLYRQWSAKWRWRERCQAYDVYIDRIRRTAKERAIEVAAERHAMLAQVGIMRIAKRLQEEAIAENVRFPELVATLEKLVKIERVSLGAPESRVAQEVTGKGGDPIQLQPVLPIEEGEEDLDERVISILRRLDESGVIMLPAETGEVG